MAATAHRFIGNKYPLNTIYQTHQSTPVTVGTTSKTVTLTWIGREHSYSPGMTIVLNFLLAVSRETELLKELKKGSLTDAL